MQASRLHDGTNFNHFLVFPARLAQTVRTSRPLLNSPPAAKLFAFCAPRFAQVFPLAHDGDAGWASWPLSSATPEQRRERLMVRAHLASLALAGGLLAGASGCCGCGGIMEGLRPLRHNEKSDCTCHEMGAGPGGALPTSIQMQSAGPVLVSPETTTTPFTGPP